MVTMKNAIRFIFMMLSLENPGVILLSASSAGTILDIYENPFHDILQDHCRTYVDKTDLLEVILGPEFREEVLLITMPTRFGKTTNLRMIQKFCEIEMFDDGTPVAKDPNNTIDTPNYNFFTRNYSFGHLKITENEKFIRENLGKHPVAHFNFKECGGSVENMEKAVHCVATTIHHAFLTHQYMLNEKVEVGDIAKLSDYDKLQIKSWISLDYKIKSETKVEDGIELLLNLLYKFHRKKVVVLVDEYDILARCVIQEPLPEEKLKDIFNFYHSIFYMALKNEDTYRVAVFTGVLHISADEGLSGRLNGIQIFPFARNQKFVKYYGFTGKEVEELFKRPGNEIGNLSIEEVKKYYQGYRVFGEDIYCPFSIIKCLENKTIDSYWAKAGSIEIIWRALQSFRLRIIVIDLCEKKSIVMRTSEKIGLLFIINFENCLHLKTIEYGKDKEINAFLNYLLNAGYFKINSFNDTHSDVSLANEETHYDLKNLLEKHKLETSLEKNCFLEGNIVHLLTSFSYDDFELRIQQITDLWNELAKMYLQNTPYCKEEDLKNMFRLICFGSSVDYVFEATVNQTEYTILQKKYNPDILIPPRKPDAARETAILNNPKDEIDNRKIGYADFIITQIPGVLVIAEMKDSRYGTSKTIFQQIQSQFLDGLLKSQHYHLQTPPFNVLFLVVHLSDKNSDPCVTISAFIIPVIKSDQFGKLKTIHCAPTGTSTIEITSTPSTTDSSHLINIVPEAIETSIVPVKRRRRPKK